jgi:hypothetical protein
MTSRISTTFLKPKTTRVSERENDVETTDLAPRIHFLVCSDARCDRLRCSLQRLPMPRMTRHVIRMPLPVSAKQCRISLIRRPTMPLPDPPMLLGRHRA